MKGLSVEEKISALIAQVKGDSTLPTRLKSSSNLLEEVGLDSLQTINLILLVEGEFGVEVDLDTFDMDHLSTLGSFASYIKGLETV